MDTNEMNVTASEPGAAESLTPDEHYRQAQDYEQRSHSDDDNRFAMLWNAIRSYSLAAMGYFPDDKSDPWFNMPKSAQAFGRAAQLAEQIGETEYALAALDAARGCLSDLVYAAVQETESENPAEAVRADQTLRDLGSRLFQTALQYRKLGDHAMAHECLNQSVAVYPQYYPPAFAEEIRSERAARGSAPLPSRGEAEDLLEKQRKAGRLFDEGTLDLGAVSLRTGLELLLKRLCAQHNVTVSREAGDDDVFSRIDRLAELGVIAQSDLSAFHRLRKTGNKGAHPDLSKTLTEPECRAALSDYSNLVGKYGLSGDKTLTMHFRSAMKNPDYYGAGRRGRENWVNCHTYNDAHVIREFVDLEARADNFDLAAALELAAGYLPRQINWCSDRLIGMPALRWRGKEYANDRAYDARYYSWIVLAAARAAYADAGLDPYYDEKYMPTALFETLLLHFNYALRDNYAFYYSGVTVQNGSHQATYADPIKEAAALGNPLSFPLDNRTLLRIARSLLLFLTESGMESLCAIYRGDFSLYDVRYLAMATMFLIRMTTGDPLDVEQLRRDPFYFDLGSTLTLADLQRLALTPTSRNLCASVQQRFQARLQEQQLQAEREQRRQSVQNAKATVKGWFGLR